MRTDDVRLRRRDFLKRTGLLAGAIAARGLSGSAAAAPDAPASSARLPRRPYGRDRYPVSVIGLGGIVVMGRDQKDANRVVAEAVERGVNYVDVAPTYGDAELKLGPALAPYREKAFLACKTTERSTRWGAAELDRSLGRLQPTTSTSTSCMA